MFAKKAENKSPPKEDKQFKDKIFNIFFEKVEKKEESKAEQKAKVKKDKTEKRKLSKDEIQFKKKFYELMFELDLYNKFKKTYYLDVKKETNYGYYAHLYLATGLSFDRLFEKKNTIEQNLKCLWIMKVIPFKNYVEVQIVNNPVDRNVEYQNPKIKPNEFYLGLSFSNQLQKTNMNDYCMFLLAGSVGSGKTRFIYQVLLSWILSCTPDEVWIYLSDIAKNEYIQFQKVKHIKHYASEVEELYGMMKKILSEFNKRKNLISQYREKGIATNIEEYNKLNKNKKLPYCILVIDELSILLPDKTDSKDEKEMKDFILDTLKRLAKLGRALGMFTFLATQKTTRDEIPSILKNMSAVRISFRANDLISSEVIIGNHAAMGLPERVAIYSLNGGSTQNYLYSPKLTMEKLKDLLQPYIENKLKSSNNNFKESSSGCTIVNFKMARIPKGVNGIEYIKSLKNNKAVEDDYIDY